MGTYLRLHRGDLGVQRHLLFGGATLHGQHLLLVPPALRQ